MKTIREQNFCSANTDKMSAWLITPLRLEVMSEFFEIVSSGVFLCVCVCAYASCTCLLSCVCIETGSVERVPRGCAQLHAARCSSLRLK